MKLASVLACCCCLVSRTASSATDCLYEVAASSAEPFHVFLTVNSRVSTTLFLGAVRSSRAIELNWTRPPGAKPGDWVGLFRRNPEFRSNARPIVRVDAFHRGGYYKTNFRFPQRNPMLGLNSPVETWLFGYYIGYISQNK